MKNLFLPTRCWLCWNLEQQQHSALELSTTVSYDTYKKCNTNYINHSRGSDH